jgi:Rrf2 family protein
MVGIEKLSKKCVYALRAIFELSSRSTSGPVKIQNIASSQAIPPRFLEVILAELKHGGFVESRRGSDGGYILAQSAKTLAVGEILSFLLKGSYKIKPPSVNKDYRFGDYAFAEMTKNISQAISNIYDNTTFADLIQRELEMRKQYVPNYAI